MKILVKDSLGYVHTFDGDFITGGNSVKDETCPTVAVYLWHADRHPQPQIVALFYNPVFVIYERETQS